MRPMLNQMPTLEISAPQIVIVASGESPNHQANARGHLFEKFIARILEAYGCEAPTSSTVNVRQNGYEVDISTRFVLTREAAIAECKAYSSPLAIPALSAFYGKVNTERLDYPETHGWFFAIPGLTADAHQLARKLESKDRRFRSVVATDIYKLVCDKGWIKVIVSSDTEIFSDHAVLLTESGVCALAKQLDSKSRLPTGVLVHRINGVLSAADLALLANTDYAAGLPVYDRATFNVTEARAPAETPTVVTVIGSKEDFEYQFPAAPEFFVGRQDILSRTRQMHEGHVSHGRVIVLNAQSGWGKSSLALRIAHQVRKSGGTASVFDTRTASSSSYVAAALRKAMIAAEAEGKINLSKSASFASLQSSLRTLQDARWISHAPLLVFFDQFENVFRDERLTREFRDLALAVRELTSPIILGFSWKTDLVALTENYPYRLRDEIRGAATVFNVEQFGPQDVSTLLGRLSKAAKTELSADLKQRIREYSQGLPWLLKKLASHILTQLQAGISEETLLAESLNIEGLFEQDLATLQSNEVSALKSIAREAPVLVSEIVERVSPAVIQTLVDQRLVVRVGERVDVYWDTFREFLITGKVAVEDTYILRLRPQSTASILQYLVKNGGEATSGDIASELNASLHAVFNAAKELRQLGILVSRSGSLLLAEQFRTSIHTEAQIRARVARALRQHTVYSKLQKLLSASPTAEVSVDLLANDLPTLFPAMELKGKTWRIYALSFALWLDYSGLMQLRGQMLCAATGRSKINLLGNAERGRRAKTFPHSGPDAALAFLRAKIDGREIDITSSARQKVLTDLEVLRIIDSTGSVTDLDLAKKIVQDSEAQAQQLSLVPGGALAIELIKRIPDVHPDEVGAILRDAYGLPWADATTRIAGTKFRAWANFAGISTSKVAKSVQKRKILP
jgi:biotin operon repressor